MRIIVTLFIVVVLGLLGPNLAEAVSSSELIEKAKDYDGEAIAYEGEVIGDVMRRNDYVWINVHDGKSAIGLWVRFSEAGEIQHKGNYKHEGDRVRAKGIFNRACPQHGGDLDIHVQELEILAPGYEIAHPVSWRQVVIAAVLSIIGGLMFLWERARKKRVQAGLE